LDKVNVRFYREDDIIGITGLLASIFPNWPGYTLKTSIQDHWKWKHQDNPYGSIVAVADINGEIIGCDHEQIRKIKIGNKNMLCGLGADTAVSPEYRGRGIFSSMLKIKEKKLEELKIELLYSITYNPILIQSFKKNNRPAFPANITPMYKILNIDRYAEKNRTNKLKKTGYNLYQQIRKNMRNSLSKSIYNLEETTKFEPRLIDFAHKIEPYFNWFTKKTPSYVNWRYLDPRGGTNKIICLTFGEETVGYMVLRCNHSNNQSEGMIVELFVHPDHKKGLNLLLLGAEQIFSDQKMIQISVLTSNGNIYEKALRRFGYLSIKSNPFVSYESLLKDNHDNLIQFTKSSHDSLHLNYGDLDL
jgi:hypothetical protein